MLIWSNRIIITAEALSAMLSGMGMSARNRVSGSPQMRLAVCLYNLASMPAYAVAVAIRANASSRIRDGFMMVGLFWVS